jgi:hypothetical protein
VRWASRQDDPHKAYLDVAAMIISHAWMSGDSMAHLYVEQQAMELASLERRARVYTKYN